jgi:hypothetical protein
VPPLDALVAYRTAVCASENPNPLRPAVIASYAARTLCLSQFEEWDIPVVGHRAEVLDTGPQGSDFSPVDGWMTIWVDPPGITKTVRYAYPREGDPNTRCMLRGRAIIPIHTYFPVESHDAHVYPSWLWPGSVVDELYELSVELTSGRLRLARRVQREPDRHAAP